MSDICEIECTVVSGLEPVALGEVEKKLGVQVFETKRGRINFNIPFQRLNEVSELRGVDNFHIVLKRFKDINFTSDQTESLLMFRAFVEDVDWDFGLKVWEEFFDKSANDASDKDLSAGKSESDIDNNEDNINNNDDINSNNNNINDNINKLTSEINLNEITSEGAKTSTSPTTAITSTITSTITSFSTETTNTLLTTTTPQKPTLAPSPTTTPTNAFLPRYRVTCKRTGDHSFQSPQAAHYFGGAINDHYGWIVDLSNFQVEVMLIVGDDDVRVGVALTRESLHRRNICSFGRTTLKPTIAHGMLWHAGIQTGDILCDPMCGTSSIAIECIGSHQPPCFNLCGDISKKLLKKSFTNWEEYLERRGGAGGLDSSLDLMKWDVTRLPLKDECVDVVVTDLPFGKRVGSKISNWQLYKGMLQECARVVRRHSGRVCLLTQDRKCIIRNFEVASRYFKRGTTAGINIGGLAAGVYMLHRNSKIFAGGADDDVDGKKIGGGQRRGGRRNKDGGGDIKLKVDLDKREAAVISEN